MHLIFVGISLLLTFLILPFIGVGLSKTNGWESFRNYSIIPSIVMFLFGILSAIAIRNEIEVLGILERVAVYTFQIWSVILAYKLIRN